MKTAEIIILLLAYSSILISIFLSLICYYKNIESWETIAFSIALLLLIIAFTIPIFYVIDIPNQYTSFFTLSAMVLVGLTTPLQVQTERIHSLSPVYKKVLYAISGALLLGIGIAYFMNRSFMEYPVFAFLGLSVIATMLFIQRTKPQRHLVHLEKTTRLFSIAFLIIVPLSIWASNAAAGKSFEPAVGFTLPLVFMLLGLSKITDDLKRLSLVGSALEISEQQFDNFALSGREKDVARLLAKGMAYKQIADELHISLPTVKTHASNIYKKCKVNNRHELTLLLVD